jgi:hypothetical protein
MTTLQADLAECLGLDFSLACQDLEQARQRQRDKDSPGHRAAVAECLARIDSHLDMWLDLHPVRAPTGPHADRRAAAHPCSDRHRHRHL